MTAFPAPPAIWERLARAGLRTLAIDPYESRPPRDWRGTYVCGWQLSRPRRAAALVAAARRRRAARRPPRPRPARDGDLRPPDGARAARAARASSSPRPARVADAAVELLGARSLRPRLADVQRRASRRAPVLGPLAARRERRPAASARCSHGALEDVYAAVDAAFGRVLAALPGDADVIVASAVGMDVNSSRADLLPRDARGRAERRPAARRRRRRGRDLAPARARSRPARAARSRARCPTARRWS